MSSFSCSIWWFVFGILVGWLLAWWLSRCGCEKSSVSSKSMSEASKQTLAAAPAPVAPKVEATSKPVLSRADMIKAAAAAGISFKGIKNDLEIVEGIGPKIAGLLNESGIVTFEDLSKASIATLNAVLEKGGARYRLANPSTWAEQGRLAAEGKWAQLKALQESLDGGVKKS